MEARWSAGGQTMSQRSVSGKNKHEEGALIDS